MHLRLRSLAAESDIAAEGAQMLYGVHAYARAHLSVDLAIERGSGAYRAAPALAAEGHG